MLVGAGLALLAVYPFVTYAQLADTQRQEHYLVLLIFILPLLAWAAVGVLLLLSARDAENRFAYLIKSIEIIIVGGLCGIAVGFFTLIAFALFGTLGIMPPMLVQRLFMIGLSGMVPVLVVAILYDPTTAPGAQSFDEGVSKLVALLLRMLLPLTILVLLFYVAFIPFRFWEPFQNRDVLIAYNAMLFAVIFLLVGATPIHIAELSAGQQRWLRYGLNAVAALAMLVSAYAFAAITYRTAQDGFTPNRLSFIGWNVINGCILLLLLVRQVRGTGEDWLSPIKRTYSQGSIAYIGWALFLVLALPWLF
ncbi:MAG: hypothetical protein IPK16_13990 [Anaerolineales bacterium]|nr:hypothetical protein [Anaerolineales bacterium]